MKLFDHDFQISIAVAADAPKAVRLAAQDLQRDLQQLSGKDSFPIVTCSDNPAIRITTRLSGEAESYTVTVAMTALPSKVRIPWERSTASMPSALAVCRCCPATG